LVFITQIYRAAWSTKHKNQTGRS